MDWTLLRERCRREALRIVRDQSAVDDIAQEALTRVWRRWHTCRDERARLAWAGAIARNEARRWLAQQDSWASLEGTEDLEPSAAWTAPALDEDPELDRLTVAWLRLRLEEEDRTLLDLRYREDLTQRDIACHLGIPPGTVAVRLHRLRARIRTELAS